MARPDPKQPGAGQAALFEPTEAVAQDRAGQVLRGRHSRAFDAAIASAAEQQVVTDPDGALTSTLRAAAWALDSMERSGHHYGPAKLIPGITEALREAHMTPESRQSDIDSAVAELLDGLGGFDPKDAHDPAPVPDSAP